MSNDARAAARSAAALAGFLVVAGAQLAVVLAVLWAVLKVLPSEFALRAGVPLSIATVGALGSATWRALHLRRRVPAGVAVTRSDAPGLWEVVDGAAKAAGVAPPDGVTVVADATATLGERTHLLGMIGGRRDLYVGLPLLQAWDTARLRAVVAHELAHGSARLGRWAPMAYRGRVAMGRALPRLARRSNPAGPALRAYAKVYRRIDAPFSRAQELAADRIAAEYAGATATAGALRDLPVLAGMQRVFHAEYLGPGWQAGHVPDDVFGGFLRVLAARGEDVAILRARGPEQAGAWDTHPPLEERLAALLPPKTAPATEPATVPVQATMPVQAGAPGAESAVPEPAVPVAASVGAGAAVPAEAGGETPVVPLTENSDKPDEPVLTESDDPAVAEPEPVVDLVPDLPGLGRALQAVAFPVQGRTQVGWDDFLSVARTAEMEKEAEAALATVSRAVEIPVPDAARVLDLAADGRLHTAATTIFPGLGEEETAERIVELLALMFALAALRSGVARWRHSWTGTAELVSLEGAYLNLADVAAAAADPTEVDAVRNYLDKIGVDLSAPVGERNARAQVLGGLVNLSADGERTDLLITDLGFVLVPGLSRGQGVAAKRRLSRLAAGGVAVDAPVPAVAPEPAPAAGESVEPPISTGAVDNPEPKPTAGGHRFVPFVDVATVTSLPGRRKSWVIGLRDGASLTVRTSLEADELPGGWAAWDEAVAFLAGTR
ncbi:M48 family metalloprotease [Actinoplanes sp. NPDC051851]|uniref:M48 family metalloprotease n=1 Tax=Actinoplanes sp. NPDC051851 TaxID=3154753 RepID=UPI0034334043